MNFILALIELWTNTPARPDSQQHRGCILMPGLAANLCSNVILDVNIVNTGLTCWLSRSNVITVRLFSSLAAIMLRSIQRGWRCGTNSGLRSDASDKISPVSSLHPWIISVWCSLVPSLQISHHPTLATILITHHRVTNTDRQHGNKGDFVKCSWLIHRIVFR